MIQGKGAQDMSKTNDGYGHFLGAFFTEASELEILNEVKAGDAIGRKKL